jgi:hypothetical protein
MSPGRSRRQRETIKRTSAEHAAIAECVAGIDQVLVGEATANEWRRRLASEVRALARCLEEHRTSAEADVGVLSDIEVVLGRSHEISTARRLHRSAERQAEELLAVLRGAGPDMNEDQLRMRGHRLSSAIRRHHELEAELILMTFDQDIGVGD